MSRFGAECKGQDSLEKIFRGQIAPEGWILVMLSASAGSLQSLQADKHEDD